MHGQNNTENNGGSHCAVCAVSDKNYMCYMRRVTVLNEVDANGQKFKDMVKSQHHVVAWHDSCSGFEES